MGIRATWRVAPLLLFLLLLIVGATPSLAAAKPTVSLTVANQLSATVQTGTRVELSAKATHAPNGAQIWIGQLSNGRLSVGKRCVNAAKICKANKTRTTAGTSSFQAVLVVRNSGKWVTIKRSRAVTVTWTLPSTSPPPSQSPPSQSPPANSGRSSTVSLGGVTFNTIVSCSTSVDELEVTSGSNASSGSFAMVYLYDYSTGAWIHENQWHNVSNYPVLIHGIFTFPSGSHRYEVWVEYAQYTSSGYVYAGHFPPYYQRNANGIGSSPSDTCYIA